MVKNFIALFIAGMATASASVTYNLDLGAGTLNGNDVTSVAIFATDGNQSVLDFPFTIPNVGLQSLTHDPGFQPLYSLIVGLDLPSLNGGDNKTHVVFFTNNDFAQAANGILFSVAFPNNHHNDFIARLLAAEGGDSAEVSWLMDFFTIGDGAPALFASDGPSTAIEFSGGAILTPEPSGVMMMGAGLALVGFAAALRRRTATRAA